MAIIVGYMVVAEVARQINNHIGDLISAVNSSLNHTGELRMAPSIRIAEDEEFCGFGMSWFLLIDGEVVRIAQISDSDHGKDKYLLTFTTPQEEVIGYISNTKKKVNYLPAGFPYKIIRVADDKATLGVAKEIFQYMVYGLKPNDLEGGKE